jgi:hypothetical protein
MRAEKIARYHKGYHHRNTHTRARHLANSKGM